MTSVQADRTLAQVVKITALEPIKGADKIELATVLGWQVVVKKDEFKIGELVLYFSIGAILDKDNPNTSFLEGKVLKTRKIRGALSQGLVGPLSWLVPYNVDPSKVSEDDDVTKELNVKKWVPTEEQDLYGDDDDKVKTKFPAFIPKTDEERIQNCHKQLQNLEGKNIVITQKYDGTSTSYLYLDGKFMICNRNNHLLDEDNSTKHYFDMALKYNIGEKMAALKRNIAIQGEIIGPKINANRHKAGEIDFFVFNIYDIDLHCYLSFDEVEQVAGQLSLKTVKVVYRGPMRTEWLSVKAFLDMADEQKYDTGEACEGIVCKTNTGFGFPRVSFKAISNKYLLKHDL